MALTRVLITVKTYPTISAKYDELVCTAGFRDDGTWIRIYPVSFRKKSYNEQYKKYDWIELDLVKNDSDFRPESFRPYSHESEIKIVGHIEPGKFWEERREIVLKKVYHDMAKLIAESKNKNIITSLAVFKPTVILNFKAESVEREWDREKLASLNQLNIFEIARNNKFEVVKKLPYKFSYVFKGKDGVKRELMVEDWEIGQLYWNCLAKHEGNEIAAVNDVRNKYMDEFAKNRDLHFFLGTTQAYHYNSHNPFIIIGTFHPKNLPVQLQGSLF